MTAQGEDILAWLDNAISVREAAAKEAGTPYGGRWVQGFPEQHKDPDMHYGWDADMVHLSQNDPHIAYQCLSDEIAALTVLHDPESVLRRCAADRKVLARHASHRSGSSDCAMRCECPHPGVLACNHDGHSWPCADVSDLAEGYGWTEGER